MMKNQQEIPEREEIVFGEAVDWEENLGGTKRFDEISKEKVEELIDKEYLDPESRQNRSPRAEDMLDFMRKAEEHAGVNVYAHGYMVSPERSDSRITLEGIKLVSNQKLPRTLMSDFSEFFNMADQFELNPKSAYCWYD